VTAAAFSAQPVARPFLKWAGGKTVLLPEILSRLPKKIGTYYEPFVGAGAVFFALAAERRFEFSVIGDTNRELMQTYVSLHHDVGKVISALKKHVYDEKHYYAVREKNPSSLTTAELAARFIYLNRTCFNGLYRVNQQGKFNVAFGRYTNPTICDEENLKAVSETLRYAEVAPVFLDFQGTVVNAQPGDAVYFDPPYVPVSGTANFTAYSAGGFGPIDQRRLHKVATDLAVRGVHVLLSNSDTPFVRELYKSFKIEHVEVPRRVNSKASKRGNVGELLISGRNQ